jgi:hypothetical protein
VNHVPPLQYLTLIRTCPRTGAAAHGVRLLARIESSRPVLQGQLLGVENGFLYWLENRSMGGEPGVSFVRRVAVTGGEVETLALTEGLQTAAVSPSGAYFTAYSVEAAPAPSYRVVYRYSLTSQERVLLTDWLYSSGVLLWREQRLYYADLAGLWQVPLRWGPPRQLNHRMAGAQVVDVQAGFFYAAVSTGSGPNPDLTRAGTNLLRQPVALAAWVRNALGR